jgi:hypothetical protein
MLRTIARYLPAAAALATGLGISFVAADYSRQILRSSSAAAAAPLAAPFLLCAMGAGTAVALGMAAVIDAADPYKH